MFPSYAGQWIPDTPARRRRSSSRMRTWSVFSNSSPVEGIEVAIELSSPRTRSASTCFGDEFTGDSIEEVRQSGDRLNRADRRGDRPVRIHAIGFPVMFTVASFSDHPASASRL